MYNGEKLIDCPLRWGMVGGGRTGQVGYKHRTGALRDNTAYRLVCGAFDIDAARGVDFGRNLGGPMETVGLSNPQLEHLDVLKIAFETNPD